jgi:CubicO group peptidase (beta-lactamase class C family)
MKFSVLLALVLLSFKTQASWEAFDNYMFSAPRNTDAVIIAKDGKILHEKYANGFDAHKSHLLWSASKSLWQLIVGHAVFEGKIKIENSICDYLPQYKNTSKCKIRIQDLLEFSSGLDWEETYERTPTESSVVDMLFYHGRSDMGRYVLKKKTEVEPASRWQYSTGDTVILSRLLAEVYGKEDYAKLPFKFFNEELGLKSFVAEADPKGTFTAGSFLYLSPYDALKLGHKLIEKYKNPRSSLSLPQNWLKDSWTTASSLLINPADWETADISGRQWWINSPVEKWKVPLPYPNAPKDLIMAEGHWGQMIGISPSENLVVVKFANQRDGHNIFDEIFKQIRLAMDPKYLAKKTPEYRVINPLKKFHFPNPLDKWHLLKIAQAYQARLFCSCYFVMKQSQDYCTQYVHDDRVPAWILKIKTLENEKRIVATIGLSSVSAKYRNPQEGCRFEN